MSLLTVEKVAAMLNRSVRTMHNRHALGLPPLAVRKGGRLYYTSDSVLQYLRECLAPKAKTKVKRRRKKPGPKVNSRAAHKRWVAKNYTKIRSVILLRGGGRNGY